MGQPVVGAPRISWIEPPCSIGRRDTSVTVKSMNFSPRRPATSNGGTQPMEAASAFGPGHRPMVQGDQDRAQGITLGREPVGPPSPALLANAFHDVDVLELAQPFGQQAGAQSGDRVLQLGEAMNA